MSFASQNNSDWTVRFNTSLTATTGDRDKAQKHRAGYAGLARWASTSQARKDAVGASLSQLGILLAFLGPPAGP